MLPPSTFHIDQLAGMAVVPVVCGIYRGTAFFIAPETLLTARHIVVDADSDDELIYVLVGDQKVECSVEFLSSEVDAAILHTKNFKQDSIFCLPLLSGEMIKQELSIIGYPYELGNCIDYFIIKVENWKDRGAIRNGFDIFVRRIDNNAFQSYRGFSGSPVINHNNQVVGIVTDQFTGTLGYLSLKNISEELSTKCSGIILSNNIEEADNRPFGLQTSKIQVEQAIVKASNRYHPSLHQENESLTGVLDLYCHNKKIEPVTLFWDKYEKWYLNLSRDKSVDPEYISKCEALIINQRGELINPEDLYPLASAVELPEKYKTQIVDLYNELYDINGEYDIINKPVLCLIGDAGTGKTHVLCKYASRYCDESQVYLFFGSDFNNETNAWDLIKNKLNLTESDVQELNLLLENKHRKGLIIIDGLNEGDGDVYWKRELPILLSKLEHYSCLRLIVSIRNGSDNLILTDEINYYEYHIQGYSDHITAMKTYFKEFSIPISLVSKYSSIELFKNPLFLYMFCVAYKYMPYEYRDSLTHWSVYRWYINARNRDIVTYIDEDPYTDITYSFLLKIASTMFERYNCGDCKRSEARQHSDILSPHKGWNRSILNACLRENLLMPSYQNEINIKFGFDNIGDFMKAVSFVIKCKAEKYDDNKIIEILKEIVDNTRSLRINKSYIANFITAFLSIWHPLDLNTWNRIEFTSGFLTDHLLNSLLYHPKDNRIDDFSKIVVSGIFEQNPQKLSINFLLRSYAHITTSSLKVLHDYLKSLSQNDLDYAWSQQCNDLYNEIHSISYKQFVNYSSEYSISLNHAIIMGWMCSSSYPIIRNSVIHALFLSLNNRKDIIIELLELFKDVKDMYVYQGIFAAIYGVTLTSFSSEQSLTEIAEYIFRIYYEKDESVPQDIIVRQWQLKILERVNHLNGGFWCWEKILSKSRLISTSDTFKEDLELGNLSGIFGTSQKGTFLLEESLCNGGNGGSDFCRYTLHMNNTYSSYTYYKNKNDKNGVSMFDVQKSIIQYILSNIGWTEDLSNIDIKNTSTSRFESKKERIGKKYQWLGLFNVEANLMDTCFMKVDPHNNHKGFHRHNFPWYSNHKSTFDPTLSLFEERKNEIDLNFNVEKLLKISDEKDWLAITLDVIYEFIDSTYDSWIPLYMFDSKADETGDKLPSVEESINYNGFFIDCGYFEQFCKWAQSQNFYGRWLPETDGLTDFLWNEYPWADSFKSIFLMEDLLFDRFGSLMKPMVRSYMGQLQENRGGIPEDKYIMSTAYMPNPDVMEVLDLHVAERGVVRNKSNEIVAFNIDGENIPYHGLLMRKRFLVEYMQKTGCCFASCIGGEKITITGVQIINQINYTGCFGINTNGVFIEISKLHKS